MKKDLALALIGVALLGGLFVGQAKAVQRYTCDPQKSVLCVGLVNVYQMEENSDQNRDSVLGGDVELQEAPNTNVARAAGKIGSYAASFTGTAGNYLYIPRGGSLMNGATISMWIYPTSNSAEQVVLSADEDKKPAPYISVIPSGAGVQVKLVLTYSAQRGTVSVTNTKVLSLNTWYLVTFGYGPNPSPEFTTTRDTGNIAYVQINDLPKQSVSLSYFTTGYDNDLVLGQRGVGTGTKAFSGRVDQLVFASRQWELSDVSAFYQDGSGAAYPFTVLPTINLNSQLVAYWKFDETSSSRVDSVSANNLTPAGSTAYETGILSNGGTIQSGGTFSTADVAAFRFVNQDFSVGGWFRNEDGALVYQDLIARWNANTGFRIYSYYNQLYFAVGNGSTVCTAGGGTAFGSSWVHVAATWNEGSNTCTIYINNTSYTGTATLAVADPGTYGITVGQIANTTRIGADEGFVYSRLLSSGEVQSLYNSGAGRTYPF